MLTGMIVKNISDTYTVKVKNELYDCKARGKFRRDALTPLVGDLVEFDSENLYILNILERKNELVRPSISNVDVALIITSVKKPDLSLYLLDKQLSSIILEHIMPVICFTKLDGSNFCFGITNKTLTSSKSLSKNETKQIPSPLP